jgi:hypothetical protein
MRDLVSYGEVRRPWIGLAVQPLTPDLARHFATRHGVIVADVEPRSPAESAGIARGDALLKVDGHDVDSPDEFEQRGRGPRRGRARRAHAPAEGRDDDVELRAATFPAARADELAWDVLGVEAAADADGLAVGASGRGARRPASACSAAIA